MGRTVVVLKSLFYPVMGQAGLMGGSSRSGASIPSDNDTYCIFPQKILILADNDM